MSSKIKNIIALAQSHYLNLYDVVYNNKNNRQKIWTVASRRDKDAFEQRLMKKAQIAPSDAVIIAP